MGDEKRSNFGFIDSVLVFLVSIGLTLVLLWIVSRMINQPWFETLPGWLTSGLGKILVGLFSTGSLATIVVKKLASPHGPNFFYPIGGTTMGFFVVILLLVFILRPHQSAPPIHDPDPPPQHVREWHKQDENDQDYLDRWSARGNCREALQDDKHQCLFTSTRRKIGESTTLFDHWKLMLKTDGRPYDVQCVPGGWQLKQNDTPGPGPGEIEDGWAVCQGWINGSEDQIQMTVKYEVFR